MSRPLTREYKGLISMLARSAMTAPMRLLVVIDPTAHTQPALARAAVLARRVPAHLTLLICDSDPHLTKTGLIESASFTTARSVMLATHAERLKALAAPLRAEGIKVAVVARWHRPLYEGIILAASESRADVVFKDTHCDSAFKRAIFSSTDWNLIRQCPAPLWLVKPRVPAANPIFVAALDPMHARDKEASLDRRILATGSELCSALHGELHAFHAFDVTPLFAVSGDAMTMPIALPLGELIESARLTHTDVVHRLTDTSALPRTRVHIREGSPRVALVSVTDQLGADVAVMGAVSRNALERLLIGSTAESVLDRISCDVLVVKATGFRSSIRPWRHEVATSRHEVGHSVTFS
jgi:universal stress protein E